MVGQRASCTLSSCPTGCTNEKRSPRRSSERRRRLICRPETASYAGVYWEQVGRLRGPCSKNGLDDRHSNLLSLRRNGARTVRKVTNAGTKNVVISEQYTLNTSNSREKILKMISEFPPPGIIGAEKSPHQQSSSR